MGYPEGKSLSGKSGKLYQDDSPGHVRHGRDCFYRTERRDGSWWECKNKNGSRKNFEVMTK
jgi:hypothetical protein